MKLKENYTNGPYLDTHKSACPRQQHVEYYGPAGLGNMGCRHIG
jgi:hypothetical protein